jgi:hypothetical protein
MLVIYAYGRVLLFSNAGHRAIHRYTDCSNFTKTKVKGGATFPAARLLFHAVRFTLVVMGP